MQRRKTNHFFIDFCRHSLPFYISCIIIEDFITKNDFFHKNSFYNNYSLAPSLPFKNKDLALTLENWKKISNQTFHKSPFFTWLISNTLWRNVGLFLSSTVQILDSPFSVCLLYLHWTTSYIIMILWWW